MTKSLVTGGAGFIGAHVVKELLSMGHSVVVLDDLSGGFKDNVDSRAVFIEGSITDHVLVEKLFQDHQFDYVYHLAAYAAEGLSHFIRRFNYNNNLIGSINIINECVKSKVKCLVFTSSIAVYGAGQLPLREDTIPQPEDPYGVAKLAVEMDLKACHEMFGLNYIVFRPHNVYGEYQNIGDRYRNVVGIFMNQLLQGKPLSVFGDGQQTRAFSYITDVAPHIARSVEIKEAYNEVFNIGADKDYSVNELATTVMRVMGINGELQYLPARNEVLHAYSDHSKMHRVFGVNKYDISLEEGLTKMAEWVKEVGSRSSSKFENIEILEKLPPSWAGE
ncbi:NAD-dependent epimerase/dehydratase family protein [Fluviicola sp.]|uniref:NAD-dependent epimerase/dehydratase family protein n=1 Tax=Fluviicola sp. TaxID=1917219 RepID=UPI0026020F80|nr:NAD-dependent epimerase/dehydratase family protein [Fluviicola sp.]